MTVKNIVKAYCEAIQMTVSAFEKSIGVANGYVNSISKSIGIDKVSLILEKYPNINIEWLLTGKGDMLKTKRTPRNPDNDNPPVCHDEDKNNNPINQVFMAEIVEKLLATIKEKDDKIAEQAAYIGRLEERIRQMTVEKEKHVADAPIAGIANAG